MKSHDPQKSPQDDIDSVAGEVAGQKPLQPLTPSPSPRSGERGARLFERTPARFPQAIRFARDQRSTGNEFVRTVWQWIRNLQICRQKFRREYPVPPYTADFCCVELNLVLELDGASHVTESGRAHDRIRDEAFARQGYQVMRIAGYDVLREPEQVLARIEKEVKGRMRELGLT